MQAPMFTSINPSAGNYLFPILFITVACGAISGFHALVSSGTSAKQLNSEKDAKLVGYGAMLIEGIVAIVALLSVAVVLVMEKARQLKDLQSELPHLCILLEFLWA